MGILDFGSLLFFFFPMCVSICEYVCKVYVYMYMHEGQRNEWTVLLFTFYLISLGPGNIAGGSAHKQQSLMSLLSLCHSMLGYMVA